MKLSLPIKLFTPLFFILHSRYSWAQKANNKNNDQTNIITKPFFDKASSWQMKNFTCAQEKTMKLPLRFLHFTRDAWNKLKGLKFTR